MHEPASDRRGPEAADAAAGREFLTFTLGREHYAIDILLVQEIHGYVAATRLPDAPEFVLGVVNLRGAIVPVVDLRLKFRASTAHYGPTTVMIVLNLAGRVAGLVVDSVCDVARLGPSQLQPPPEMGAAVDTRFIRAIAASDDARMLIVLDIERLVGSEELALFERVEA